MNNNFNDILSKQLIDLKDPEIEQFKEDFYGDFYDFFANFMKFKQLTQKISQEKFDNLILTLYLDIFNSQDFSGQKTYRYCLAFDSKLNFLPNKSFFTLSGLTRDLHERPDKISDYQAVNEKVIANFVNQFDSFNADGNVRIQKFNVVLADLYNKYNLNKYKIAYSLK